MSEAKKKLVLVWGIALAGLLSLGGLGYWMFHVDSPFNLPIEPIFGDIVTRGL